MERFKPRRAILQLLQTSNGPPKMEAILSLHPASAQDWSQEVFLDFKDGASDASGPGGAPFELGITGQEGDGFESKRSDAIILSGRNDPVAELAVQISSIGLELEDFIDLAYVFVGIAESNSFSPRDLFVNDYFDDPLLKDQGVEYDNTRVPEVALIELNQVISEIPEPSSALAVALGFCFMTVGRRCR